MSAASIPKGRPEILFPLFSRIDGLAGVGPKTAALFDNMDIKLPRDLLFTLPQNGITRRYIEKAADARPPEMIIIPVEVSSIHRPASRNRPWRVTVSDGVTDISLVFFHARPEWIEKEFPLGQKRVISGKIEAFDGVLQIVHPDHVLKDGEELPPSFEPVYPLTAGLGQRQIRKAVASALQLAPPLDDWIDPGFLAEQSWPDWNAALSQAHAPRSHADISMSNPARARLAYDELFAHQMTLALVRKTRLRIAGRANIGDGRLRDKSLAALPWPPTAAQLRAVDEIAADMASPHRMSRLLQGDVGSGKTLVAWLALMVAVEAGGQGVLMAPTEILARQHFSSLTLLADKVGIRLAVLTGRDKPAHRATILADLEAGLIDVLVGTHTVFQDGVNFADLRLAVIDEQHRFGVAQRLALSKKGAVPPDLLVMTATPIPRSLALTQYGDMELSVLDEKPAGRQPITTIALPVQRLDEFTDKLSGQIADGARVYWVCPLVAESEQSDLTAAEARFESLRARFGEQVRLIHGQMPAEDRDRAMADFASGIAKILVATTVIEVGVDVPEANLIVIERAESFGLAQLHQLRGRVGRGSAASTCVLFYRPPLTETAQRRIAIMRQTEDGFRIAEEDLAIRGAGDVIGTAQSGLPRFRVADLERQAGLMAIARQDVRALLTADPELAGPRGRAARVLLWLMGQDEGVRLLAAG